MPDLPEAEADPAPASGPLAGTRVLDLTRLLPGGFATALLADLGAEVIKVEQPGRGDYLRWKEPRTGSTSAQSWISDRNKRSIALDLKVDDSRAAFMRLVPSADIVFEGFRPGVAKRLGVSYDDLAPLNPRLVYCSLTGYGQTGPQALEAGHDLNYIGRAGLLSITGPADGAPAIPGVQIGDVGGGSLMSLVGVLSALVHARATGEGDYIDISMTDGAFAWLSGNLGIYLATEETPQREGAMLTGAFPCYAVYECGDGLWMTVGAIEAKFFEELCAAVGRPDLIETHTDPAAFPIWRALFKERTRTEWTECFAGMDVCVGPVNDFSEAIEDPQLQSREMLLEQEDHDGTAYPQLGNPIKLRNNPPALRTPPPKLGQDTRTYLEAAGISAAGVDRLLEIGAAQAGSE